jgi:hypothetical protein
MKSRHFQWDAVGSTAIQELSKSFSEKLAPARPFIAPQNGPRDRLPWVVPVSR